MAAFRCLFLVVVLSAVASEALFLPAVAGATALPVIIGGKLFLIPKVLAVKLGIGMLGLKFAGARYLREKVLIPASLAGAVAGYKATSTLIDTPHRVAEMKTLAVERLLAKMPKMSPIPTVPAPPSKFETSFKVPAVPVPSLQWQETTVKVPKVVFQEPVSKTITVSKHVVPAYPAPEPPKEEIVDRPY